MSYPNRALPNEAPMEFGRAEPEAPPPPPREPEQEGPIDVDSSTTKLDKEMAYAFLNVPTTADLAAIRKAKNRMAMKWHPDKNKDPKAERMFHKINKAYELLAAKEQEQKDQLQKFKERADAGDVEAQVDYGHHMEQAGEIDIAVECFRQAAEKGYKDGCREYARCLRDGKGVEGDLRKAAEWYQKGAEKGDDWSKLGFGEIVLLDQTDGFDVDLAVRWMKDLIDAKNMNAQNIYGIYLVNHGRTDEEKEEGARYLTEIHGVRAHGGTQEALFAYAMYCKEHGSTIRAIEYFRKLADKGHIEATREYIKLYLTGNGILQNYDICVEWCNKLIENGDGWAMGVMGDLYRNGHGVRKDIKEAERLYREAIDRNMLCPACYGLGLILVDEEKYDEALKVFEQGANADDADCICELGKIYELGTGIGQDLLKAFDFYERAANMGCTRAIEKVGELRQRFSEPFEEDEADIKLEMAYRYDEGDGIEQDKEKALDNFREACALRKREDHSYIAEYLSEKLFKEHGDNEEEVMQHAREAVALAEEQNDDWNRFHMSRILLRSKSPKDQELAFSVIQRMSDRIPEAAQLMCVCLFNAWGCTRNANEAIRYFCDSFLNHRDLRSGVLYGFCHLAHIGWCKDPEIAARMFRGWANAYSPSSPCPTSSYGYVMAGLSYSAKWGARSPSLSGQMLERAANGGNCIGQYLYGLLLESQNNRHRAFEYYEMSADQGYEEGRKRLAHCYWNGIGCERDRAKAKELNPNVTGILRSCSFPVTRILFIVFSVFVAAGLLVFPCYMTSVRDKFNVTALVDSGTDFSFRSISSLIIGLLSSLCLGVHLWSLSKHTTYRIWTAGLVISMVCLSGIINTVDYVKALDGMKVESVSVPDTNDDWHNWSGIYELCQGASETVDCIASIVQDRKDDFQKNGLLCLIMSWVLSMFVIVFFINKRVKMILFRFVEMGFVEWYLALPVYSVILCARKSIYTDEKVSLCVLAVFSIVTSLLVLLSLITSHVKRKTGDTCPLGIPFGIILFCTIPEFISSLLSLTDRVSETSLTDQAFRSLMIIAVPHYIPGLLGLLFVLEWSLRVSLQVCGCIYRCCSKERYEEGDCGTVSAICKAMCTPPFLMTLCARISWDHGAKELLRFIFDGPQTVTQCLPESTIDITVHVWDLTFELHCSDPDAFIPMNQVLRVPKVTFVP